MNIAVAGTGYVGLSLATLLSQKNTVTAVDIIEEKSKDLNEWKSPTRDEYIEKYFAEAKAGKRKLDLHAAWNNGKKEMRIHPTLFMQKQILLSLPLRRIMTVRRTSLTQLLLNQ